MMLRFPHLRTVIAPSVGLLASLSSCSLETATSTASVQRTCADHHPASRPPVLVNAKLAQSTRSLCFGAFLVLHSGVTRTPLWVAEHLTRASVAAARRLDTRDNRFHPEERVPAAERAELADYRGSGFDRGHMAPSGDMGSAADDYESFSLANIVPQDGPLNRGGWAGLESYLRDLAARMGEAYVVTGPAYEGGSVRRVGGRVLVPTHVWKAVHVPSQGAGAWIASNDAGAEWEVVSIAQLTERTGVDPFPRLDAAARARVPAFPTFED